ncbi:MAG: hypothetical protein GTO22_17650, partial [Gemmatimonadales bacterium]|nr:hypothetical protein [Gemmatimonadales bacterium]
MRKHAHALGLMLIAATLAACAERAAPTAPGDDLVVLSTSALVSGDVFVDFSVSGNANLYYHTNPEWNWPGNIPPSSVPGACIEAGGIIAVEASGCVVDAGSSCTGPNGYWWSIFRGLPVYSLIGRWSTDADDLNDETVASASFFVGSSAELTAPATGGPYYLFLGENNGIFADNSGAYSVTATWDYSSACPRPVDIDIKPGSDPNSINLGSNGSVPVAIFSTADFDATTVDPSTVILADAAVKVRGKGTPMAAAEDVNGDGLLDLVVHVETSGLALTDG